MKIIIAPGAYKQSLGASAVADAIALGLRKSGLAADLILQPIADGGNGTLDAFLAQGGERILTAVVDPLGRPRQAAFGMLPDGETAVIEMALASGLELITPMAQNPMQATTYGTGQLMAAALDRGARRLIIGMGGSATVDGGAGCAQALGVKLLDEAGHEIPRGGGGLAKVATVDISAMDPRWREVEVIIASDVENPTLGETGAAAVFGPQKGASPADVKVLEANLRHFFTVVSEQTGVDVREVEGGGAAGALSAGLMAFVGGKIQSGIDLILEYTGFDALLKDAQLVITGEGQIDAQTIYGKGPIGVARLAGQHQVPTVVIVGGLNVDDTLLHDAGIQAAFSIVPGPMALDEALERAEELVQRAAQRLGYVLQISR